MLPLIVQFQIGRWPGIWFPMFLVWLVLLVISVPLIPLLVLAEAVVYARFRQILVFPLLAGLWRILSSLRGIRVRVKSRRSGSIINIHVI